MSNEGMHRLVAACGTSLAEAATLLDAEPALLEARDGIGETALHYLAVEGELSAVRFLHERGADIEARNEFGESALDAALRLAHGAVARYLLDHGADVHGTDAHGRTMLHAAALGGDADLVRLVIDRGVPVDARDGMGETPLFTALLGDSPAAVVRCLAGAGAGVNERACFHATALHTAARYGQADVVELLLAAGADPTLRDVLGDAPADEADNEGFHALATRLRDAAGAHHAGPRTPPASLEVRALAEADRERAREILAASWGSTRVVSRGRLHDAGALPGLLACEGGAIAGLLTYRVDGGGMEVVTLDVDDAHLQRGIGRALLAEAEHVAIASGCARLWLVTTNDNVRAQRFYAALGWTHVATHAGAIADARRLKPEIPERGYRDVAIEDELEYERRFD